MQRRLLLRALLFAALLPQAACNKAPASQAPLFQLTDITGAPFGGDFALSDHAGQRRSLQDYRGKVVALMFGYLHCPDMCPTTLLELKQVLQRLGPQAGGVQVLFVTLDPQHDTSEVLSGAVARFDPRFVGLRGSEAEISQLAEKFNLVYQQLAVGFKAGGSIEHSAGVYVFDRGGKLRLYAAYGSSHVALEHDLRLLLQES